MVVVFSLSYRVPVQFCTIDYRALSKCTPPLYLKLYLPRPSPLLVPDLDFHLDLSFDVHVYVSRALCPYRELLHDCG